LAGFANIPDLAIDIPVPENATLAITLQGEAEMSGGRMFIRATIDGTPCSPSDIGFTYQSGHFGTSSMTFVQKNVKGGTRHVVLQWHVDEGQTGYSGDRNMTVVALPFAGPDLTSGFQELKPAIGTYPVLVLLWDPQRPTHPAPTVGAVTNLIHGSHPSVADYFKVNSGNNVTIANAGILGWFSADKSYSFYWAAEDPADADGDGFTSGHVRKWWEAVTKAGVSFDFASYDSDGDGVLDPTELGVVIVIPQNGAFGTVRVPAAQQYPTWQPLVVDGVRIPLIAEVYAGSPPNLGVFAHEMSHLLFNLPDMYFTFFYPYAAGQYSLMDVTYIDTHLDPFHKIHLGWLQPTIVRQNGKCFIYPIETGGEAYILMDPKHGEKEYFIVENRQRSLEYDTQIADSGLAVWHIMEDPAVYGALAAPTGVSATDWAAVPAGDWGRRAVRMIRPVYGLLSTMQRLCGKALTL
jgi:M6 family metalloprotease-like protein